MFSVIIRYPVVWRTQAVTSNGISQKKKCPTLCGFRRKLLVMMLQVDMLARCFLRQPSRSEKEEHTLTSSSGSKWKGGTKSRNVGINERSQLIRRRSLMKEATEVCVQSFSWTDCGYKLVGAPRSPSIFVYFCKKYFSSCDSCQSCFPLPCWNTELSVQILLPF